MDFGLHLKGHLGDIMGRYTTRVIEKDEYKLLLDTLKSGYSHKGVTHKPNEKMAAILVIERNLGIRLSDVIKLKREDIVKQGREYRLNITEKKTGKDRTFMVPKDVRDFIEDYAESIGVTSGKLFRISEAAVWKAIREVTEYLNMDHVSTHSVRKSAGVAMYEETNCNIEMVREFYQHSSIATTQAYLKTTSGAMQKALRSIVDLG